MSPRRVLAAARQARRLFLQMDDGQRRSPADFSAAAVGVSWLVRFAYLFLTYEIAIRLDFGHAHRGDPTDALWPISLLEMAGGLEWMEQEAGIRIVAAATGLLAVLFPGRLVFRLGVFLYVFFSAALGNSYGWNNHHGHFAVYVSFALLFLPSRIGAAKGMTRSDALTAIAAFWFVQILILLPYTLAGFWKARSWGLQLLSTDGFARLLVTRAMEDTTPIPVLLPFLASQPVLSQIAFVGVVYLQFFALLAFFRPALQRPFGFGLMAFHFGTDYVLNIGGFYPHVVYVGIFLVFSPFAPARPSLAGFVRSLPIFGIPFRLASAYRRTLPGAQRAWLVYDGECYFCQHYARLLRVREAVGELTLVNARDGGPLVEEVRARAHDLNDGMALKIGARWHLGNDALHTLALLSDRRGVFGVANRLFFGSARTARLAYPVLKLGRRALLRMRRVPPLGG